MQREAVLDLCIIVQARLPEPVVAPSLAATARTTRSSLHAYGAPEAVAVLASDPVPAPGAADRQKSRQPSDHLPPILTCTPRRFARPPLLSEQDRSSITGLSSARPFSTDVHKSVQVKNLVLSRRTRMHRPAHARDRAGSPPGGS